MSELTVDRVARRSGSGAVGPSTEHFSPADSHGPGERPVGISGGSKATTASARLALLLIRGYQLARVGRVSPCRFVPTCSEYAAQALSTHGTRRGLALTARRLGRCRPGGPSGYDPVPEKMG